MPYRTNHHDIEIEYIPRPDGSVDLNIKSAFGEPAKIGKVTVNEKLMHTLIDQPTLNEATGREIFLHDASSNHHETISDMAVINFCLHHHVSTEWFLNKESDEREFFKVGVFSMDHGAHHFQVEINEPGVEAEQAALKIAIKNLIHSV